MNIRSRFWGTLAYSIAFMTLSKTIYPKSSSVFLIILNVFPLSCTFRFFTFSKKIAFGWCLFIISATSKNKVPRVSLNPFWYPAIENAWQGNPAHNKSKLSGIKDFVSSLVISPNGTSPKFSKYVFCACKSHSEEKTHLPPRFWQAIRNPPIPAKRSMNVNLGFLGEGNGIFRLCTLPPPIVL